MTPPLKIRSRDRDAIIQSLRSGVVPRRGQQHIQVGRARELKALLEDITRVADQGSSIRFAIGRFGSGKTFFMQLVRSVALEKKLVTAHADLAPDKRIHASAGQARTLYAELMRNLATRSKPEGGALASVVDRFISTADRAAKQSGKNTEDLIRERLSSISELVGGYAFAEVLARYWEGHDTGNEALKADAIRWLRAEFSTKTDAKRALGVRTIIDDSSFYEHLKLMARFVRSAGYGGLFVCLDEMVNLYKLTSSQARKNNYEQILRILNDCLQGEAVGLGFVFCGTPEFLTDTRRGLFSYEALQTRLAENRFAGEGLIDMSGPVIRLENLTPEDLFVLLRNIRNVFAATEKSPELIDDEGIEAFMRHCFEHVGEAWFKTPRATIREFVGLLSILEQNPEASWENLVGQVELTEESNPDLAPLDTEDETASDSGDAESDDDGLTTIRL